MTQSPLTLGGFYHIYNRGNNGETIFKEERNYRYFLNLYGKYIAPIVNTYAYCLLGNHFHILLQIKQRSRLENLYSLKEISQHFATFFGTYTKAINKAYSRTGSLFEGRFKRKPISQNHYFAHLIVYIHRNPQLHGFVDDYRHWPYSSYQAFNTQKPTRLNREAALECFDGQDHFFHVHEKSYDFESIAPLVEDDFIG